MRPGTASTWYYPVIPNKTIRPPHSTVKKRCNSPLHSTRNSSPKNTNLRSRNVACFAEQLIPLRSAYKSMSEKIHEFTCECNIDETSPDLMTQFKVLDNEYEIFCSQANIILSSIHPSKSLQNSMATSTTLKQAHLLTIEWKELITKFNNITGQGLMPHFHNISKKFEAFKVTVKGIIDLFSAGNLMSNLNPNLVRKIFFKIDKFQKYFFDIYRKVEFGRYFEYNASGVYSDVEKLIKMIGSLFQYRLPAITMSTGDVMRKKFDVTMQSELILKLVKGTANFTVLGNETIDKISEVNLELKKLFEFLKIPYELELKFTENEEEDQNDSKKETKKLSAADELIVNSQKAVDSMRKRIKDIEMSIFSDAKLGDS